MKKIAIIGSNGMLGSDLVKYLSPHYSITQITKANYSRYINKVFDVVLNANGNSKRFWANKNPQDDFIASTASVLKSIFDFPSDRYIYISSVDVYENHTGQEYTKENQKIDFKRLQPYGFHKYLAELIVKKYLKKYLILRPSMILGAGIQKGPFYDIIHKKSTYITHESGLQLITTHAVAEIIITLLKKAVANETINIGGIGVFNFKKIPEYFDGNIKVLPGAETQNYEMNNEKIKGLYPELKTSEEYLKDFLTTFTNK